MAKNTNYHCLPCADLNSILKDKGIPYSSKRKVELIYLCESAEALNLQTFGQIDDNPGASILGRAVKGKTYPAPCSNV